MGKAVFLSIYDHGRSLVFVGRGLNPSRIPDEINGGYAKKISGRR